ncbi:phosphonate C-P lyase system protein PhnH [Rhodobacter sp. KR11]|uniref:phosphonate C-P lyase system protein PhnH n=1 Tax=Rhodobacter sp. KR11 TaxID=2974588 RepID=UPI0022230A6E|nr:phosphonate C-P lyase system protein PhnH [Rhodobacter sp. KR11]MCW1920351.1 phosphonate C-P lyase system protein PhnH [Rhodobacter sp. KR11]
MTLLTGGFHDAPRQSARAFRLALNALSRPGRIETVSGAEGPAPLSAAAATLLLVLADRDTPIHLGASHDVQAVRDWITFHTGAPFVAPEAAMLALGTWDTLPRARFPLGLPDYPDRSATLIVETATLTTEGPRLTGPGIQTEAHLSLPEVTAFQENRALFPQGLDFFFTCGARLAALPRSTRVEAV